MRLSTLHKRRKQRPITEREMEAFAFCNRYAPVHEIKRLKFDYVPLCWQVYDECCSYFKSEWKWIEEPEYRTRPRGLNAGELFYQLKNRVLARYGRSQGFVMQHWTVSGVDWDGDPECRTHSHILEVIRLKKRDFHQPTGHFHFSSDNGWSTYNKQSVGFDEMAKLTAGKPMFGTKADQIKPGTDELEEIKTKFVVKLRFLLKRFRPLMSRETKSEKPRVIVYHDDYENRRQNEYEETRKSQPHLFENAPF